MPIVGDTLSVLAAYDDQCRHAAVLHEESETAFLAFVKKQKEVYKKWLTAELECQRLQKELGKEQELSSNFSLQLKHARRLLNEEVARRKPIEEERDALERKINQLRHILLSNNGNLNEEARLKTEALFNEDSYFLKPTSSGGQRRSRRAYDSACSVLSPSELSYDQSEDDLDSSRLRRKRPSVAGMVAVTDNKRIRGATASKAFPVPKVPLSTNKEQVIATTTVTVPLEGPITASSVIEAKSPKGKDGNSEEKRLVQPSAPPKSDTSDSEDSFWGVPQGKTPLAMQHAKPSTYPSSAASLFSKSPGVLRTFSSGGKLTTRAHAFVSKTTVRLETCGPCGKRVKFGKSALRCRDCHAICHAICKDKVPLPCVPCTNTPVNKGEMLTIADFTPLSAPMVPALVVHCINEIEQRGLSEVGIYRVPGAERDVKSLKERFLKGKGPPNLSNLDVHVLCGCLKDFLRSLRDPLVTRIRWRDFVKAAENKDQQDSQTDMMQAIADLPQPNRDTLAFLILHLQRVAECPECKMSASNLAKVFGPTIVGYSEHDPKPMVMLTEVAKQQMVMEKFMLLPADYWSTFVNVDETLLFTPHKGTGTGSIGTLVYSESAKSLHGTPRVHSNVFKRHLFSKQSAK